MDSGLLDPGTPRSAAGSARVRAAACRERGAGPRTCPGHHGGPSSRTFRTGP